MKYLMFASFIAIVMILSFEGGKSVGYEVGRSDALSVDPVNEELELVCAGLWIGEQNKKYWAKENK